MRDAIAMLRPEENKQEKSYPWPCFDAIADAPLMIYALADLNNKQRRDT